MIRRYIFCYVLIYILLSVTQASADSRCFSDSTCNMGICNRTCSCFEYAAIDSMGRCSYLRTNRRLAGALQLLSFLCLGGVGNLILGYTLKGWLQLAFTAQGIPVLVILYLFYKRILNNSLVLCSIFTCTMTIIYTIGVLWSIADGVKILAGIIPDAAGIDTY